MDFRTVDGLLRSTHISGGAKLHLKEGQVFFGKVLKLFPKDRALVQLGGTAVLAKLEAPLVSGASYWLKVVRSKGIPQLRVVRQPQGASHSKHASIPVLLEEMGVAFSKAREAVVRAFTGENMPFSKEMVTKGGEWLQTAGNKQAALGALKQMAAGRLPFVRPVFDTLLAGRQAPPFHEQIRQLASAVNQSQENFASLQKLRGFLAGWMLKPGASADEARLWFQRLMDQFGSRAPETSQVLKSLLLDVAQQAQSPQLKQQAQQLLLQMISQQWTAGNQFQTVFHLPLQWGSHSTDVTVKWEGKKQKNGTLDADFCRILFYLELELLKETVVDVHIQKRLVTVRIFNEVHDLDGVIRQFQPILKDRLETAGYRLAGVNQAKGRPGNPGSAGVSRRLGGVDFRI
ncbi:MAG TPA: hypothetical protein VFJ73_03010 [Bacillales bacterium]|nr:hypothetical protein [Bacillales bacterium]